MKKKYFLLYWIILANTYLCGQTKEVLDVCTWLSGKPALMAFKIPIKKCTTNTENSGQLKNEIENSFEVNGKIINLSFYLINKVSFVEVTYNSPICDTVTKFFVIAENKKILYSKSYSIDKSINDVRVSTTKGSTVLYRKIKIKEKNVTVSFEFDTNKHKLNTFVDDGLSLW